jgi:tryptophanyl-tRNA synthetase
MGLDDPGTKMSKSRRQQGHAIFLLDSPDEIPSKITKATTDSEGQIRFDDRRPGINNLLTIYQALTGLPQTDIESHFRGKEYNKFKQTLAEAIIEHLRPLRVRYNELSSEASYVDSVLKNGESKAHPIAIETLSHVKARIGLG